MVCKNKIDIYGTGTVGERGQIVIPIKARNKLKIKQGSNFIFFGKGEIICLIKANQFNKILNKIVERLNKKIFVIKNKVKLYKK